MRGGVFARAHLLELRWLRERAADHLVVAAELWDEERGAAVGQGDGAVAAGLAHAEEVVEVALLPEERLVVRVEALVLLAALQQDHAGLAVAQRGEEERGQAGAVRRVQRGGHAVRARAEGVLGRGGELGQLRVVLHRRCVALHGVSAMSPLD